MADHLFSDLTMPNFPGGPVPGSIYRHTNGGLYRVIMLTNLSVARDGHPPDVVYVGQNGSIWSRRLSDWGRSMTLISSGETK